MPKTLEQKPILVASDLSHRSDRAMQRAFDLARRQSLPVVVVTALDDAMPEDMVADLHASAITKLERFAGSLGDGVEHRVVARVGDPTDEILGAVEEIEPTLLVMGVHRPRGFLDALRETTMQRIVRRTGCPVLLVRDTVDHEYKTVIAACDFSPASTSAMELADSFTETQTIRPIHALHVPYSGMLGPTKSAKSELERAFQADARKLDAKWREGALPGKLASDTEIVAGSPYSVIRQQVEKGGVDLICVGAHGRVGAAPAVLGSLATDLMRDAPCDLLIARP